MPDTVYCESCDHSMRQGPSWTWLCLEAPREGNGFVTRKFYDKDAPYERCVKVNAFGNCRWWKATPEGDENG